MDYLFQKENINWYKEIDSNGKYLCKFCELKYSTVQTLRHHVKLKHLTEAQAFKSSFVFNKRRKQIKCHVCYKKFMYVNELKSHANTLHLSILNKSCFYCKATFLSIHEKENHEETVHNNVKGSAYFCNICGYRSFKKSSLTEHQNNHLSIGLKKCKYCDYCSNKTVNLRTHERIHTNMKPYKCDYYECTYSSSAKSALNSHKLSHSSKKLTLYCDQCIYKTVYLQSFKKHQKTHNSS